MCTYYYNIAGWGITINIQKADEITNIGLMTSFSPFRVEKEEAEKSSQLLKLTICEQFQDIDGIALKRIKEFDTGNGIIVVDKSSDGGYKYEVKDISNNTCAIIKTNADFTDSYCMLSGKYSERLFGLNNTLMLVYAFAASFYDTLLIHASVVKKGDYAYAFIAKSGTGKSTQVANWIRAIEDCEILNDDNPIVRLHNDGTVKIYGSPWSGKTPCYRNRSAILSAINQIKRAPENRCQRMSPIESFAVFLPACSTMKWEKSIYDRLVNTVSSIIERVPIFTLECLPTEDSAIECNKTMLKYTHNA